SRLARELGPGTELWATRRGWPASGLAELMHRPLQSFFDRPTTRLMKRAKHYGSLSRRFSASQITQIVFDKFDGGYKWRAQFSASPKSRSEPVVLLPSAYENVSRMAAAYARLLPGQTFLLAATRQSGKDFEAPPNVLVRDLASY